MDRAQLIVTVAGPTSSIRWELDTIQQPHAVIAMRLLDGGGISAVTSDRRRTVDYVLAMRIMLHQIQKAVRS
jgi:hypothetical protein